MNIQPLTLNKYNFPNSPQNYLTKIQEKAKKPLLNLSSDLIMAPDRKVLNSCVSTPRNTQKAGITNLSLFVHICPLFATNYQYFMIINTYKHTTDDALSLAS